MSTELPAIVAEYIAAMNALDTDRIVATFTPDAYVNDNRREYLGHRGDAGLLRQGVRRDHVTIEVREVIDHHGDILVGPASTAPTTRRTCPTTSR